MWFFYLILLGFALPLLVECTDILNCSRHGDRWKELDASISWSCYYFSKNEPNFNKASSTCQEFGGSPVVIETPAENQMLWNEIKNIGPHYIGLIVQHDPVLYYWVTNPGVHATYTNWADGEPNNHSDGDEYCVQILRQNGKWNDIPCDKTIRFICEKPEDTCDEYPCVHGNVVNCRINPSQCPMGYTDECYCDCDFGYKGDDCDTKDYGVCKCKGDPHCESFDGKKLHYQGDCEYLMTADNCIDGIFSGGGFFQVYAKFWRKGKDVEVSWVYYVTINLNINSQIYVIVLHQNRDVTVDNSPITSFPYDSGVGFSLRMTTNRVILETDIGLRVKWDGVKTVIIVLEKSLYGNETCGLCGVMNDDTSDDFTMGDGCGSTAGDIAGNQLEFGDSWEVSNAQGCCNTTVDPVCSDAAIIQECEDLVSASNLAFGDCVSNMTPENIEFLTDGCIVDVCLGGDDFCDWVLYMAEICQTVNWDVYPLCEPECPPNASYLMCEPQGPLTCDQFLNDEAHGATECSADCYCDDGYYFLQSDDKCVLAEDCGCIYENDGQMYPPGTIIIEDSENCGYVVCENNEFNYYTENCDDVATCELEDDVIVCNCPDDMIDTLENGHQCDDPCENVNCNDGTCVSCLPSSDCQSPYYDCDCDECYTGDHCETAMCPAGSEEDMYEACTPCSIGTYKKDCGPGPCDPCPEGETTSSTGSTSSSACKDPCDDYPCVNGNVINCQANPELCPPEYGDNCFCDCDYGYKGPDCSKDDFAVCKCVGDPHCTTSDNVRFHYQGDCEYLMVADECYGGDGYGNGLFEVYASFWRREMDVQVSWVENVTIFLNLNSQQYKIELLQFMEVKVGGITVPDGDFPYLGAGFRIKKTATKMILRTNIGLTVKFDGHKKLIIRMKINDFVNETCGLCGVMNGNPDDDFTTGPWCGSTAGEIVTDALTFGDSWDILECCNGGGPGPCPDTSIIDTCNDIINENHALFGQCVDDMSAEEVTFLIESCIEDLCFGKDDLCSIILDLAELCQIDNLDTYEYCKPNCPDNASYLQCAPEGPLTCYEYLVEEDNQETECSADCYCDDGYYFRQSDGTCVLPDDCGCLYEGKMYEEGEVILVDDAACEYIMCEDNEWIPFDANCDSDAECDIEDGTPICICPDDTIDVKGDGSECKDPCDNVNCNDGTCVSCLPSSDCQPPYYDCDCDECYTGDHCETAMCPAGSEEDMYRACIPCSKGTYKEDCGPGPCDPCPDGETTASTGSTSSSACKGNCVTPEECEESYENCKEECEDQIEECKGSSSSSSSSSNAKECDIECDECNKKCRPGNRRCRSRCNKAKAKCKGGSSSSDSSSSSSSACGQCIKACKQERKDCMSMLCPPTPEECDKKCDRCKKKCGDSDSSDGGCKSRCNDDNEKCKRGGRSSDSSSSDSSSRDKIWKKKNNGGTNCDKECDTCKGKCGPRANGCKRRCDSQKTKCQKRNNKGGGSR